MSDAAYLADNGSPEQVAADAAEAAKVEQAKAEVYEERAAAPPDNLSGRIISSLGNTKVRRSWSTLIRTFKGSTQN